MKETFIHKLIRDVRYKEQPAKPSPSLDCGVLEIWNDIKAGQLKKATSAPAQVAGVGVPFAYYQALRADKAAFFHFCSNYQVLVYYGG
jgi:hypothetical protein